jgi:hypothetical protein
VSTRCVFTTKDIRGSARRSGIYKSADSCDAIKVQTFF